MEDDQEYPQDVELHRLIMSHIGDKYKVEIGHRCTKSQTGEEYKGICLVMLDMKDLARTMAAALSFDGKEGDTLYWMVTPGCEHQGDWGWKAYMRYLVSDKTVVYDTEHDNPEFANTYHGRQAA